MHALRVLIKRKRAKQQRLTSPACMQRATKRHLLLLPYPTASAELSGCGAVGFSGAMSSMDAATSSKDGFTRAPLNPTAPHHVPQQQKR